MMSFIAQIVTNGTAAGSVEWPGGQGKFYAHASTAWGGDTLRLQYLADTDGSTDRWVNIQVLSLSDNDMFDFSCPQGRLRAVKAGTGSTGLDAWVARVMT
jgi:hypothetical protein